MPIYLLDVSLAAFCCCMGIWGGWWLRSRGSQTGSYIDAVAEREFAQSILARVQEVAQRVAVDVGEHSSRVQEINDELAEGNGDSPEAVVEAINKLMAANDIMQRELEQAESTMKTQAEQIQAHATAALTDALTGLANRRALDAELEAIVARTRDEDYVASVLLCDVDHFKKFNDTHGHLAGDEVLRRVGQVMQDTVRDVDFVARYGGEEFSILFPGTPWHQAVAIADRTRQAIEKSCFEFEGTELRVTVSMGLAQYADSESIERWIQRADEGLYASKEAGRNCGHFHNGEQQVHFSEILQGPDSSDGGVSQVEVPAANDRDSALKSQDAGPAPSLLKAIRDGELIDPAAFSQILQMRLAEHRRGGPMLSVIMLEIDELRETIAQRGAHCGDVVLRATAQFLQATMREMDVVSNTDDGRFALLLPTASLEDALQVAERLRRATARCKLQCMDEEFSVTISLGVTAAKSNDAVDQCLQRAEVALAEALKQGNVTCLNDGAACISSNEFLGADV